MPLMSQAPVRVDPLWNCPLDLLMSVAAVILAGGLQMFGCLA